MTLVSVFHRCYEVPTALRQCDGFRWVCGNATGFAYISSGVLYQPLLFLNIGHFGLGGIVWQHIQTLNWIVVSWCVQSGKSSTACSIRGWKSSEWTTVLPGMKSRQVTWTKDVATIRRFCESLDAGMLLKCAELWNFVRTSGTALTCSIATKQKRPEGRKRACHVLFLLSRLALECSRFI